MTEVLPRPMAADGVVFTGTGSRTLTVRLSDQADVYTKTTWRQGWQMLRRAYELGWPASKPPWVWADVPGASRVVHGQPAEGGLLAFHFPPGTPGYAELISKPGLVAIVTMDRGTSHILSVRFLNRP